ncbi:MAG: hypothetical protein ACYC1L_03525 [Alphaproteobacteria bacterium]
MTAITFSCAFSLPVAYAQKVSEFGRLRKTVTKKYLGKIVNKLKHESRHIRTTAWFNKADVFIPAYFLEGVQNDGALGPDIDLHTSQRPAISYARDLRFHFVKIYETSKFLSNSIKALTKSHVLSDWNWQKFLELGRSIAALDHVYLPYEAEIPNPWISVEKTGEVWRLVLTLRDRDPKPVTVKSIGGNFTVMTAYKGDGVSKSYKIL